MYPIVRRNTVPARSRLDSFFDDDWGFAPIVNALFNDAFNAPRAQTGVRTNVTTNDNDYRVDIVIPGLSKDDIVVDISDDNMTVSYEAKENDAAVDNLGKSFASYRSFSRSWSLPQNTNAKNITAEYNQGILSITVPKVKPETPVSHRVEVK